MEINYHCPVQVLDKNLYTIQYKHKMMLRSSILNYLSKPIIYARQHVINWFRDLQNNTYIEYHIIKEENPHLIEYISL